jgi:hypothetical protein
MVLLALPLLGMALVMYSLGRLFLKLGTKLLRRLLRGGQGSQARRVAVAGGQMAPAGTAGGASSMRTVEVGR